MWPCRYALLLLLLFPCKFSVLADEPDKVRAKLDAALETFKQTDAEIRKAVLDSLATKEAEADRSKNQSQIDKVQQEKAAYEAGSVFLPSLVDRRVRLRILDSQQKLTLAFELAISDYTKKRMPAQADIIEKEYAVFMGRLLYDDGFNSGTTWTGTRTYTAGTTRPATLEVTQRYGERFHGSLSVSNSGDNRSLIAGTIKRDGTIEWQTTQLVSGAEQRPHRGRIAQEKLAAADQANRLDLSLRKAVK